MKAYLIAIIAGALSVAAYAPLEWWWLMPLCLGILFQLLQNTKQFNGFRLAFLFSLGQFGVGASWVYVSLQTYGNMPVWMAAIAVFFFVAACASLTGLMGFIYARYNGSLQQYGLNSILFFTVLWVLAEWSRSILFTGFPWLDIGYSQTTQWLSGYAPIGSVYLVSFVTVFVAALLCIVVRYVIATNAGAFLHSSVNISANVNRNTALSYGVIAVFLIAGGAFLRTIQWSQALEKSYQVVIVQANVSVDQKWLRQNQSPIINDYIDQISQYNADLVILPETALPVSLHQTDDRLWRLLRGQNKALLSGVVERDLIKGEIYNSANLVCDGFVKQDESNKSQEQQSSFYQGEQIYRKQHLVPFGEYLPLRNLLNWVLAYLQIPMSDFSAGEQGNSLNCDQLEVSVSICYEDAFASEMRHALLNNKQSGMLVNISEDAWFGNSLAPHQRVQMAQMRAIELARPMLRSANSGPSTFIDFQGKLRATTAQFQQDSMQVEVTPRQGDTPFLRFGLWIIVVCLIFFVGLIARQKIFLSNQ